MSNPFFTYGANIIPGMLGRAETVAADFLAVQAGFALLAIQGTDSGAANAYTVATAGGQNAQYADGMIVEFKAANANTGASTIAVDGGATVGLTNSNGQSLTAGAISAGTWYRALYNSTYTAWTIIAPTSLVTTSNTISAAAPTHLVGLVAAGGVSTACAPIDVTFALDQSIVPKWTGAHTFGSTVTFNSTVNFATGLTLTGAQNQYALTADGSAVSGKSFGLEINAGTNASDIAFLVNNQTGGTPFFEITGVGGVVVGSPTDGSQGLGTINATGLYINGTSVTSLGVAGANPGGTVGLVVANGTATTFMRSDAAPPLSEAIAPTWTGAHVFTPGSNVTAVTVNAPANVVGATLNGGTNTANTYLMQLFTAQASGFSSGLWIKAGTTIGDFALTVNSASNAANYFNVRGDGVCFVGSLSTSAYLVTPQNLAITAAGVAQMGARNITNNVELLVRADTASVIIGAISTHPLVLRSGNVSTVQITSTSVSGLGPVAGGLVDMTPDTGSFNGTFAGFTTTLNPVCTWSKQGNQVTLTIGTATGSSNSVNFTMSGLPAAIQPTRAQVVACSVQNNNNNGVGVVTVSASSTLTFGNGGVGASFSAANGKGIPVTPASITYLLN